MRGRCAEGEVPTRVMEAMQACLLKASNPVAIVSQGGDGSMPMKAAIHDDNSGDPRCRSQSPLHTLQYRLAHPNARSHCHMSLKVHPISSPAVHRNHCRPHRHRHQSLQSSACFQGRQPPRLLHSSTHGMQPHCVMCNSSDRCLNR